MNMSIEPELQEEITRTPSEHLFANLRDTLESALDEHNHRGDFAALDELERRLGTEKARREGCEIAFEGFLDDDRVMRGFSAVRKMLQLRVGDKHAHAEAFRKALKGEGT